MISEKSAKSVCPHSVKESHTINLFRQKHFFPNIWLKGKNKPCDPNDPPFGTLQTAQLTYASLHSDIIVFTIECYWENQLMHMDPSFISWNCQEQVVTHTASSMVL